MENNPIIEPIVQPSNHSPLDPAQGKPISTPAPTLTPNYWGMVESAVKTFNQNKILIILAVLAVLITGVLVYGSVTKTDVLSWANISLPMSKDAVAKKSADYLNANVLQEEQVAELGEVSEASGVIKMQIKIGTSTYDSYATKDGKMFFPEAFVLDTKAAGN